MENVPVIEVAEVHSQWDPTIHADIPADEWRGPVSDKNARAIINTTECVAIGVFHPYQNGSYKYYFDHVFEHKGKRMYKYCHKYLNEMHAIVAREVIGAIVLVVDVNHTDGGLCTIVTKMMSGLEVAKFSLKPNVSMRAAEARLVSHDILIGMDKATSQTKVTLVMGGVVLSGCKVLKAPTLKRATLALPARDHDDAKKPKV